MKLFSKSMLIASILLVLVSGQALADKATGKVSRTTTKIVFLDDANQTAVHVSAVTKLTGAGSVASMTGKDVEVTFHKEGNRNIADSIVVKSD